MAMKISFILPGGGRSGGVGCTVSSANGLRAKSHDVRLLVYSPQIKFRAKLSDSFRKIFYRQGLDWLEFFNGPVYRFQDIKDCSFKEGEIVIASGWLAAKKMQEIKNSDIIKVHYIRGIGLDTPEKMKDVWGENVPKIATGSYLIDYFKKNLNQEIEAIIPDGIDVDRYYPSVPSGQRVGIGTIYGISYHKDPKTVLSSLAELQKTLPDIPQYVFGAYKKPKVIPKEGYWRLPSLEKAREIYSRCLVWIMASCSEGFSVPILEAMACGCGIVATDCGGPSDIIRDGENGFLVEVGNVRQITDRVRQLVNDPGLRRKMIENSLITVKEFSWENSIDKLERFLQEVDGNCQL